MNTERLHELFDAWSESRLTTAEAAELNTLLRTCAEAREFFRDAAAFHGQLHAATTELNLERAASATNIVRLSIRPRAVGMAAAFLIVGLSALSIGWLLASPTDMARVRYLELRDGGFEMLRGAIPSGFPAASFTWGGDPSEVAAADAAHPRAMRFIAAAGENNIPNSPRQSCDIFQIIDLKACQSEIQLAREAFVEVKANFLDARAQPGEAVRFICKVYVFEGAPNNLADVWPLATDQIIGSGAQFHISTNGSNSEWKTVTTRCVLPPTAGFLVVQIGAGSARNPGALSPQLGEQYVDDISLTLHTRQFQNEVTARR
jgi:hypothetical protein